MRVGLQPLPGESVLQWVRAVGWEEDDHPIFRHCGSELWQYHAERFPIPEADMCRLRVDS
eukprot:3381382-Rhodomonas_salina.1